MMRSTVVLVTVPKRYVLKDLKMDDSVSKFSSILNMAAITPTLLFVFKLHQA
jgi:hypothetical protein